MTEAAGKYAGMDRYAAREALTRELRKLAQY
jgi:valyl-tRNA synthetase